MEIDKVKLSSSFPPASGGVPPQTPRKTAAGEDKLPGEQVQLSSSARQELSTADVPGGEALPLSRKDVKPPIPLEYVISSNGTMSKICTTSLTEPPSTPVPKAKWTILTYLAGDNDLEEYVTKNLVDMEKVGSSDDVYLVAQIDRGPDAKGYNDVKNAARYFVVKGKDPSTINSPVIQKLGPTDMGDPKTLKDFLAWGMKNYPAENYLVILNDHGGGFTGALQDTTNNSFMPVPKMKDAILKAEKEAGVSKENVVLGFDACLMGQAEVAYELKDTAKILLASEEMIAGTGWPYGPILTGEKVVDRLQKLTATAKALGICGSENFSPNPEDVARMIIQDCAEHPDSTLTMSAIDLSKMDKMAKSFDILGSAILAVKDEKIRQYLKEDIDQAQHYTVGMETSPYSEMRDAYDIALRIGKDSRIQDDNMKKAANQLILSIEDAIIAEEHKGEGMDNSHGLSVYAPTSKGAYDEYSYHELSFAKATKWDDAMMKFTGKPDPNVKPSHTYKPPVRPKSADEKAPPVK